MTPSKQSATVFTMNLELAQSIIGGLSEPSKMPCYGFSIPASRCKTGSKLRKVAGSVCSICYALKGRYVFGVVQNALERRFSKLSHPQWVKAMAFLINTLEKSGYFRWHDAGDIQSLTHLQRIVRVCKATPHIKHWLPTREYGIVAAYVRKYGAFPANLNVRLSAYMMDGPPPSHLAKSLGVQTSGVLHEGFTCPAPNQGNKCLDCRACWITKIPNVNYKVH